MAEFRAPFLNSFLINETDLIADVLQDRPDRFPKSGLVTNGLAPLMGNGVFTSTGDDWQAQRQCIARSLAGCPKAKFSDAINGAVQDAVARMTSGDVEIETPLSNLAADVIFRLLFGRAITRDEARKICNGFRTYQRHQPLVSLRVFLPRGVASRWPRRRAERAVRGVIKQVIRDTAGLGGLMDQISAELDPQNADSLIDQATILVLAGHESSAAALSWALYLLAGAPDWQERVACGDDAARAVLLETLRLYPPVPMLVRQTCEAETFRNRPVPRGAQVVISLWHLHRHRRHWATPDQFTPEMWLRPDASPAAFMPFSAGPRQCPGQQIALREGIAALRAVTQAFTLEHCPDRAPVPVARLTLRSRDGIYVRFKRRS